MPATVPSLRRTGCISRQTSQGLALPLTYHDYCVRPVAAWVPHLIMPNHVPTSPKCEKNEQVDFVVRTIRAGAIRTRDKGRIRAQRRRVVAEERSNIHHKNNGRSTAHGSTVVARILCFSCALSLLTATAKAWTKIIFCQPVSYRE